MGAFFGTIIKGLLTPITILIGGTMWSILVTGPLRFLNTLQGIFDYYASSSLSETIFGISISHGSIGIVDGWQFFSSSSPIRSVFNIMIAIGIGLGIILLAIRAIFYAKASKVEESNKYSPLAGFIAFFESLFAIYIIPVVIIFFIGLSSLFLDVIIPTSSKNSVGLSASFNITGLSNDIDKALLKLNAQFPVLNGVAPINPPADIAKLYESHTLIENIDNISAFITNNPQNGVDTTPLLNSLSDFKKSILDFQDTLKEIKIELPNLKIGGTDESVRSKITSVFAAFNNAQSAINGVNDQIAALNGKYVNASADVIKQTLYSLLSPSGELSRLFDISKTGVISSDVFGNGLHLADIFAQRPILLNNRNVESIYLLWGGKSSAYSNSLMLLKSELAKTPTNKITVILYQLAKGTNDEDWESYYSPSTDWSNLILGSVSIIVSITIFVLLILQCIKRIFVIGLYFVASPAILVTSVIDQGNRASSFAKLLLSKIIAIGVILISFRACLLITDELLKSTSKAFGVDFVGTVAKMLVVVAGLGTAYKSSTIFARFTGDDASMAEGIQDLMMLKGGAQYAAAGIGYATKQFRKGEDGQRPITKMGRSIGQRFGLTSNRGTAPSSQTASSAISKTKELFKKTSSSTPTKKTISRAASSAIKKAKSLVKKK